MRHDPVKIAARAAELLKEGAVVERAREFELPAGSVSGVRRLEKAKALLAERGVGEDEESLAQALAEVGEVADDLVTVAEPEAEPVVGQELVDAAMAKLARRGVVEPDYEQLGEALGEVA